MTNELRAKFENYKAGMRLRGYVLDELDWIVYQDAHKTGHASRDAEVEALKRDAERYRWLRELDGGAIYHLLGACDGIYQEKVDAAIDAAMAKESGE